MLLAVDSLCVCDTYARFSTEPVEIKYILSRFNEISLFYTQK